MDYRTKKIGSLQNFIVGDVRKMSVTISGELEMLPETTETSVKSRKWN